MALTNSLTNLVDWFYIKPFHRLIPKQTFRYIVCGGINFALTILCYALAYYLVFTCEILDLGFSIGDFRVAISRHVAALGISLPINFLTGFWLQKNITFKRSPLKAYVQFLRYFLTAMGALLITYYLTKVFAGIMPDFPTVAQVIIYCVTAVFSFVMQKFFTFKGAEKE